LRSFEEVSGKDEKTHMHVVRKREGPDFFLGTQQATFWAAARRLAESRAFDPANGE
jgi:16S rRNA U1498 N3-methylase RsmE